MNRDEEGRLRERIIDASIGQATPEEVAELEREVQASPLASRLRAEWQELKTLVTMLRKAQLAAPGPRFRGALESRLHEIDEARQPLVRSGRGARAELRFQWERLRQRLERSPSLRWGLLAALVVVAVGLVFTWDPYPRKTSDGGPMPLAGSGSTFEDSGATAPIPSGETASGDSGLYDHEPSLADASPVPPPRDDIPRDSEPVARNPSSGEETVRPADREEMPDSPLHASDPSRDAVVRSEASDVTEIPLGDRCVIEGLRWLVRQQGGDGSWTPGGGEADLSVAVTSLAGMALVSGLAETRTSLHEVDVAHAVDLAVGFLLSRQDESGWVGRTEDPATSLFNHATATLALSEWSILEESSTQGARLDRVAHALDVLEMQLGRILHDDPEDRGSQRCLAHNAAWSSLALATASAYGRYWLPRSETAGKVEQVLALLSTERPMLTATQAIVTSFKDGDPVPPPDGWGEVVADILDRPGRSDPALVFLVSTALCPDRESEASSQWKSFRQRIETSLIERQDPQHGYFRSSGFSTWPCFHGGDVCETALALLTLEVPARARMLKPRR